MDEQDELEQLLGQQFSTEDLDGGLIREDRLIIQPDGTRACVGYELSGQGYSIINPIKQRKRRIR